MMDENDCGAIGGTKIGRVSQLIYQIVPLCLCPLNLDRKVCSFFLFIQTE
jgi:hypothetical protein